MARKKTYFQIRLMPEEKEFIESKSKDLGYNTVSAFMVQSAKTHFILNVDMSVYRKLTREINYIGKNINSIIRRINTEKFYSDLDISVLERRLEEIKDLISSEYKRLGKLEFDFTSDDLSKDDTEKLIESFRDNNLKVPKHILLEEVYQKINDTFVLIIELVKESKYQDESIEDYIWEYLYGNTINNLDDNNLIDFSDKLFKFYEKVRLKKIDLDYQFSDKDWIELIEILDEYEIY